MATSRLEALKARYGLTDAPARAETSAPLPAISAREDHATLLRLSHTPVHNPEDHKTHRPLNAGDARNAGLDAVVLEAQLELSELAERYRQLQQKHETQRARWLKPSLLEQIGRWWHKGRPRRLRAKERARARRFSRTLGESIDGMTEVLNRMLQRAQVAQAALQTALTETEASVRTLEQKQLEAHRAQLIEQQGRDLAAVQLRALERELRDIDRTIEAYEDDIDLARTLAEHHRVEQLSSELREALEIKDGLLEGRFFRADAKASASAALNQAVEGQRSAGRALSKTRQNREALAALLIAMRTLSERYERALVELLPAYRRQSEAMLMARQATENFEAKDVHGLLEENQRLVTRLCIETHTSLETTDATQRRAVIEALGALDRKWSMR